MQITRRLSVPRYMSSTLKTFGVWDAPQQPFIHGRDLPEIPQNLEDIVFGQKDFSKGCCIGTYQQVSAEYAHQKIKDYYLQCLCNTAKRETAPCGQFERTKPASERMFSLSRKSILVSDAALRRGPSTVFLLGVWVPALCDAFTNLGLVLIQVRSVLLPLSSSSISLDCFYLLVSEVA